MKENGGPAFPCEIPAKFKSIDSERGIAELESQGQHYSGMTLRDYFASAWVTGYVACPNTANMSREDAAKCAYQMADAILKEREK